MPAKLKELIARHMAIFCVAIFSIGAVLRLSQYIANRSLWIDEAMLALNVVNRSFYELAQPQLDYAQSAPLGFLLGQKLLTVPFGNTDYVLRILPLICGLASIWAMYALAKRVVVEHVAIIAAVALFAISDRLIYYASEAKQYSSDVLICLLLLLAIARNFDRNLSNRDFVRLAVLGTAALWFSHPALFILAGAGATLGAHFIWDRDWRSTLKLGFVTVVWLGSLLLLYFIYLRPQSARILAMTFWNGNFMPLPPWRQWGWFINTLRSIMTNPIGLPTKSAISILVFGSVSIFIRRWQFGIMLLLPILLTLVASALHEYPFADRMILFLVPIILLIVAEAIGRTYSLLDRLKGLPLLGLPVALAIFSWIAIIPAYQAARYLRHPRLAEEIKPLMSYLSEHSRHNNVVYVYYGSVPAFRYYSLFYRIDKVRVLWGIPDLMRLGLLAAEETRQHPEKYFPELNTLRGKGRVWIIISHDYTGNEKDLFLDYLDKIGGRRLDQVNSYGTAWLVLYDL